MPVIALNELEIGPAAKSVAQFVAMVVPTFVLALTSAVVEKHVGALPGTQFVASVSPVKPTNINAPRHVSDFDAASAVQ